MNEILTHIEVVEIRKGSDTLRVITGSGIYSCDHKSLVGQAVIRKTAERVRLVLRVVDGSSRIVGVADRYGNHIAGEGFGR